MKGAAILLILIVLGVSGCGSLTEQSAGARDHLVGWYKLGNTVIPVFKTDGTYYSVCLGLEAPLKECPEGLEWTLPSSIVGTKIGFDEMSNAYYIIIEDRMRARFEETPESIRMKGFKLGEKTPITRIEKPSWLLDATAQPPRTNDDFLGWYQAVWVPIRYAIRKDGERYFCTGRLCEREQYLWETKGEPIELTTIPDRLGFMCRRKDKCTSVTYNETLKRFELELTEQLGKRQPAVIRMPLARVSPHPELAAVPPPVRIGIPFWH